VANSLGTFSRAKSQKDCPISLLAISEQIDYLELAGLPGPTSIEKRLERIEDKLDRLLMPHEWGDSCRMCGAATYKFDGRWICLTCGGASRR
jgi:hypothetical protein